MPSTSQPNFLFITTDQQRWDALGIHNPRIRTPAMDSLARDGMRFDRAYPTNAICAPARASMITGRSQRGHHVFNNVNLSEAIPVVGDSLRQAGYATALVGKPHFKSGEYEDVLPDDPPPGAPVDPDDGLWYGPYFGFDYVEILGAHTYPKGHWRVWLERHHPEGLELWKPVNALAPRTGAFHSWKNAIPAEWHYTHRTADRTVDWLEDHGNERPFFLWMSFYDPHQPFTPPHPYCDMYDPADMPPAVPREDVSNKPPQYQYARDGLPYQGYDTTSGWDGDHHGEIVAHYYGMTTFIDDGIARVLAELDPAGPGRKHPRDLQLGPRRGPERSRHCRQADDVLRVRQPGAVAMAAPRIGRGGPRARGRDDAARPRADLARPRGARIRWSARRAAASPRCCAARPTRIATRVIVERIAIFGSGIPELVGARQGAPGAHHAAGQDAGHRGLEAPALRHHRVRRALQRQGRPRGPEQPLGRPRARDRPGPACRATAHRADQRGRRRSAPGDGQSAGRRQPA